MLNFRANKSIKCLVSMKLSSQASMAPASNAKKHYKLLVVGGGAGGITVATKLQGEFQDKQLCVVEPSSKHYYQPLWTLVGAGLYSKGDSTKSTAELLPKNSDWIQSKVAEFQPEQNCILLEDKTQVSYDYLVVASGLSLRYDKIEGAEEALENDPRVCSNYSERYVEKTYPAFQNFQKGQTAIFTYPNSPIKCGGGPQKAMYLFEDYLKTKKKINDADIHYFTSLGVMFPVKKYSDALSKICDKRHINKHFQQHLVAVDYKKSEATFEDLTTKEKKTVHYDLLHIVPPMAPPESISKSPLADQVSGYLSVDQSSLRNSKYPNIYALGDCSSLPISKTAAAIASQSHVLATNLRNSMYGKTDQDKKYEGYTSCPLITGYNKGIIAEFDYTNLPKETMPINQAEERQIFAFIKKFILPSIYWDFMLNGMWSGPGFFRKILNPSSSKQSN